MAAYLIVEIEVIDGATYEEYIAQVPAVVNKYGGRYLARTADVVPLAGGWMPERMIVIEFPSMEQLAAFGASPEYRALAPLREASTRTRSIAVPGVEGRPG